MIKSSFFEYLSERQEIINRQLKALIPPEDTPPVSIYKAMHYSLMANGKRFRPIMCLASAEAIGGDLRIAIPFACAIEMVHTYSLIHDDLPAMDDDDLRRGKPTCHKVFNEAIAILAGDALLTQAFAVLCNRALGEGLSDKTRLLIINELAEASGTRGMIGGQVLDIEAEDNNIGIDEISEIHTLKTGALIRVSVRIGAFTAGASEKEIEGLSKYGECTGLAFQIMDDVLDLEANEETLGKTANSDVVNRKATYPAILGIEESKKQARKAYEEALSSICFFDHRADPLRLIARYAIMREK